MVWPGWLEATFCVNHLAAFDLTLSLLPDFAKGTGVARVVHVASAAHRRAPEEVSQWTEPETAAAWLAAPSSMDSTRKLVERYGISKLAQLAFALELNARAADEDSAGFVRKALGGRQLISNAVHPVSRRSGRSPPARGALVHACTPCPLPLLQGIVATGILRGTVGALGPVLGPLMLIGARLRSLFVGVNVERGALPQLYAAGVAKEGGLYITPSSNPQGIAISETLHSALTRPEFFHRVWETSQHLIAQAFAERSPP